jgi:tubulin beta
LEVVYGENRIGGSGEYCGQNDAHLGRIIMFYHKASGGKYMPRAVLFDLEPGVIGAVASSRRSAYSSSRVTSCAICAGNNWAKGHYKKAEKQIF